MAEPARREPFWTFDAWLQHEQASEVRHELVDGELFNMAGGSEAHALLGGDVYLLLGLALRGRPCRVIGPDLLVRVGDDTAFYPDVQVRCPDGGGQPTVVVEVLSDSTEAWDRGGKFERYRRLPHLRHYVLVAQDRVLVEHFRWNADGSWTYTPLGPGAVLALGELASLPVDEIYARVSVG